jgi:hypothetical protein
MQTTMKPQRIIHWKMMQDTDYLAETFYMSSYFHLHGPVRFFSLSYRMFNALANYKLRENCNIYNSTFTAKKCYFLLNWLDCNFPGTRLRYQKKKLTGVGITWGVWLRKNYSCRK